MFRVILDVTVAWMSAIKQVHTEWHGCATTPALNAAAVTIERKGSFLRTDNGACRAYTALYSKFLCL